MRMVGDWEGTQIRSHRRPIVVYGGRGTQISSRHRPSVVYAGDVYRLVPSII